MKIKCNIIKDLLPLYAEKLTSEESNSLILEHISECESCKNEYEKITEKVELPTNLNDYINLKKAKRKDRNNLIIGIISVVLFLLLIFALIKPYFPYLYTGDRISITVNGEIDNEQIEISQKDIICNYDGKKQEVNFDNSEKVEISTKGNEYGSYIFNIATDKGTVKLELIHTNWWEIHNVNLFFNIDTESNTLIYQIDDYIDTVKSDDKSNTYYIYYML
jgi:hypothetical protein